MVEWYWQWKTPDSSTRTLWQSYQQSHVVAEQDELVMEIMNLAYEIFISYFNGFFNMP
jgi:hypothetical protein